MIVIVNNPHIMKVKIKLESDFILQASDMNAITADDIGRAESVRSTVQQISVQEKVSSNVQLLSLSKWILVGCISIVLKVIV